VNVDVAVDQHKVFKDANPDLIGWIHSLQVIHLPLSMGATASHASLVISHSSVSGLSEAWRAAEREKDLDAAGAKASAVINKAAARITEWNLMIVLGE